MEAIVERWNLMHVESFFWPFFLHCFKIITCRIEDINQQRREAQIDESAIRNKIIEIILIILGCQLEMCKGRGRGRGGSGGG